MEESPRERGEGAGQRQVTEASCLTVSGPRVCSSTILNKDAASGRWSEFLLVDILVPFYYTSCDWQNWNRGRRTGGDVYPELDIGYWQRRYSRGTKGSCILSITDVFTCGVQAGERGLRSDKVCLTNKQTTHRAGGQSWALWGEERGGVEEEPLPGATVTELVGSDHAADDSPMEQLLLNISSSQAVF